MFSIAFGDDMGDTEAFVFYPAKMQTLSRKSR